MFWLLLLLTSFYHFLFLRVDLKLLFWKKEIIYIKKKKKKMGDKHVLWTECRLSYFFSFYNILFLFHFQNVHEVSSISPRKLKKRKKKLPYNKTQKHFLGYRNDPRGLINKMSNFSYESFIQKLDYIFKCGFVVLPASAESKIKDY